MSSAINDKGSMEPVTLLWAKPNVVMAIKDQEKDGYRAIQLGFGQVKNPSKPLQGQTPEGSPTPKIIREFSITDSNLAPKVGDTLTADLFRVGDEVKVTGISKGKGFAGVIKRHGFSLGRKTHGGRSYRRPGSIGSMYPQRIFPGKKMAGRMGNSQVTTKGLTVALVDPELAIIGVKGSVPGPKKGIVLITEVGK
ncbi:50S ribosomal protein L3 [Candidatus Saccharibacteria bacterium RIFCSPLOWO2_01_FULL_48_13]|nr:MAG: 50S ribosomal protein L3 [Candidatus Saccharibacteria bacterium RIFCSPHIGHO2_01_FULL_48_12]OGL35339.1 MAG: 50S ribosomal protein L3 [Candidatus Saccharibacteria bacterium RIFCSPHIGHO2_12_FULL_48_21]OGL37586.1 MAG: 50S ribosomal protein L3 [Candidatus Saccharibacteria bacterium RIFCSPLOWO2_01_FULL_48_13]